uniref:PAN2-PAN3 deadenylation complex catalytic subunit PAN2 n=1 Tax=Kwoniella dejecticola CBS 10117 TaxID=1296121 RepID=A0A1A6ADB9_9TREE|nr:PAB-dependent poly(A)-specific ribonuclease subunit PAN2 [Kwoniella dejecticola CBS 10117]OBR88049.1 PAB-dependent poly(A)-specific ribonuclease subunit PAN2 [Kwoniella dejecticola CBS 10117]
MTYNPLHLLPLPPQSIDPKPVPTTIEFDSFSDTLWLGTSSGTVTALCTPLSLTRNVQFPAHGARSNLPSANGFMGGALLGMGMGMNMGVKEIRITDRDVWTLAEGGIGGRMRGGRAKWTVSDPTRSLRTMTPNPTNSHEVLAGGNGQMILANTSRGEIVRRIESNEASIVKMAPSSSNRAVLSASLSGQINLLDPRTAYKSLNTIIPVQAHTGGLSGADVQGNLVCTWGWTHMQGHPMPDPLVKIYDIRTLRPLPPISFPAGPAFALLHPTDPSKLVISSQQGMLQSVDMSGGSAASTFQQLDVNSYVTSMALSPRGDYLAFGDADGHLHLWTQYDTGETAQLDENGQMVLPTFNGYEGIKPEWPDQADTLPPIVWEETTPLNLIGMPYYSEALLSNFPPDLYATEFSPFYNPPLPVPTTVLNSMKMVDFVGYATTPKELKGKRYVIPSRPGAGKNVNNTTNGHSLSGRRDSEPRFRSEKDKKNKQSKKPNRRNSTDDRDEAEEGDGEIPKYYRKVEIKYSKFGIEDFDFEYYNRTTYSGLETDILNSYTNALLQAIHYILPIRKVATAHICVDCKKEHCLLCEAGFLFRMLEDAKGRNCQASNFSRAFSATPQASALGLMDDNDKSTAPYGSLIQNFNRWLLSTFSNESIVEGDTFNVRTKSIGDLSLDKEKNTVSAIDQVLGLQIKTTNTCRSCGFVSARDTTLHAVDLIHPKKTTVPVKFDDLLRSSIFRENTTKAVCSNCKSFTPLDSKRSFSPDLQNPLPPILSVNTMMNSSELYEHWKTDKSSDRFLQPIVTLEGNDTEKSEYEVKSLVVQIQEDENTPAHLVSFVKENEPTNETGMATESNWIMFNDFLVRQVTEDEVFTFPGQWKVPSVIILQRIDTDSLLDLSGLPKSIDPSVLLKDVSIAWNRRNALIKHTVFTPSELPTPGTLVAIDAEFVALQQEEMEFRSDGTKNILRPSHMSLARVSVLRGQGEKEGVPFIDDYIHTSETVVDYLTEFSGIKAGDLDPNNSPHTLVPLKVAYKKLRLLVDLGCIFIGHGLAKDFRTINIFIPSEQVMDTVHIFTIPGRQRKLSLKFLAWYLLKKDIQTNSHDSIEDSKFALLLYKLYREYVERDDDGDEFRALMDNVFNEGHKLGFKPPAERPASPSSNPTAFPPLRAQNTSASTFSPSANTNAITTNTNTTSTSTPNTPRQPRSRKSSNKNTHNSNGNNNNSNSTSNQSSWSGNNEEQGGNGNGNGSSNGNAGRGRGRGRGKAQGQGQGPSQTQSRSQRSTP